MRCAEGACPRAALPGSNHCRRHSSEGTREPDLTSAPVPARTATAERLLRWHEAELTALLRRMSPDDHGFATVRARLTECREALA